MERIKKFTLYLGLNDKDSKVQEISTVEAYKIVTRMLAAKFGGGTVFEATGVYKHVPERQIVIETTLRIEILFADEADVRSFVEELKKLFNQKEIAVQSEVIQSELW